MRPIRESPKDTNSYWWSIKKCDLDLFKYSYVLTAPIARSYQMAPGKMVQMLKNVGIMPVSGPAIDGSRQYLYRRGEIEKAGYDTSIVWNSKGSANKEKNVQQDHKGA